MKKKGRLKMSIRVAALAGGLALTAGTVFSSYATSVEIEDARKQVSALEAEKKKVEGALSQLESLKADTAAYVKALDGNLAELAEELEELEGQIREKETQIDAAQAQLEAAKEKEAYQYATMKLRIKYMYENGNTSFVEMIMESGSMSELLNRAEYVSQIAEYDRKKLVEFGEVKNEVAAREQALSEEYEGLVALQDMTKAKQSSAEQLMSSKQAELAAVQSKIDTAQDELDQYAADIKAQEDQMKRIEAEMKRREEEARKKAEEAGKTYTVSDLGNISFKWPCPSSSRITSNFGDRESPTEGASSNHKGMDIGAGTGADIIAAADGQVVISTYSYSAGNYIMIDHGGGVSTVYMHCSQLLVSEGAKVTQGQVIAKVGSTGYSTGPHLHFGIRSGGSYVNPRNYVSP